MPDPIQDIVRYNREAWDKQVQQKNRWTIPVTPDEIALARAGTWQIILTPEKAVPGNWFPDFRTGEIEVLCLAGAGGQQAPILAAAGAKVTVLDNSPSQLEQDRSVAAREGLTIRTVQGDMADLSPFESDSFDLIVHPCSNTFVPNVIPVWREAARVLKPGGDLLSGFVKPVVFLFDDDLMNQGQFKVAHKIPYSDLTSITPERRQAYIDSGEPLCFGHTLTDQIGGQIEAGLNITGFFEDGWEDWPLSKYIATFIATKATKSQPAQH